MSENIECPTAGCHGDIHYPAPGRGHIEGCHYPLPVSADTPTAGQGEAEAAFIKWFHGRIDGYAAEGHAADPDNCWHCEEAAQVAERLIAAALTTRLSEPDVVEAARRLLRTASRPTSESATAQVNARVLDDLRAALAAAAGVVEHG